MDDVVIAMDGGGGGDGKHQPPLPTLEELPKVKKGFWVCMGYNARAKEYCFMEYRSTSKVKACAVCDLSSKSSTLMLYCTLTYNKYSFSISNTKLVYTFYIHSIIPT